MDEISSLLLQNIQEIDEKDERQVLAELAGETVAEYVYEFDVWEWVPQPGGGKKKQKVRKAKLSWVGTREVARDRGNIVLSDPLVTETEDSFRFMVKATDLKRNFSVFGGVHVPKQMKINETDQKTGEITGFHMESDPFVFQKGLSKAQRNALTYVIPATFALKMIDHYLKAGNKGGLNPGQAPKGLYGPKPTLQKSNIKPRAEWDKTTKDKVPDFAHLETIMWDLSKLQPADMYKELGVTGRSQMTIPAWDAFLTLKDRFSPPVVEEETKQTA